MKIRILLKNTAHTFLQWKRNHCILSDTSIFERQVVNKALSMAKSKKVVYIMSSKSFISNVIDFFYWRSARERRIFNFPKAYLFVGLTDYAMSKQDLQLMKKIAISFESYININGTPSFIFNKVDQVPFAMAALNLYQYLGDEKYKVMADYTYQKLISWSDPISGIIQYRKESQVILSDMLGMVCPFLVRYGEYFEKTDAIDLAYKQIEFYILYGVEKDSHLPVHGIVNKTKIKVGPTNWGRGIGWYMLALSFYSKLEGLNSTNLVKNELSKLITTLNLLKTKESEWSQFPGSSNHFDASTTTMFMLGVNYSLSGSYSKDKITRLLGKHIDKRGAIINTSGETFGINSYSNKFGQSELSQGILLMLLSTTYQ